MEENKKIINDAFKIITLDVPTIERIANDENSLNNGFAILFIAGVLQSAYLIKYAGIFVCIASLINYFLMFIFFIWGMDMIVKFYYKKSDFKRILRVTLYANIINWIGFINLIGNFTMISMTISMIGFSIVLVRLYEIIYSLKRKEAIWILTLPTLVILVVVYLLVGNLAYKLYEHYTQMVNIEM